MAVASRPLAQDIGLFLILVVAADTLFAAASDGITARMLMWSFYLMILVHVGQSLYCGTFSRLRGITWVALIIGWTVAEMLSFTAHILPVGQVFFWIATNMPWAAAALEWLMVNAYVMPVALLALLAVDIAAQHARRGFSWSSFASLLAVVLVVAAAVRLIYFQVQPLRPPEAAPTFEIMPPWHLLPFYAMLRAVPDKTAAVALAFIAIALPVFWPWMKADALRTGTLHRLWLLLWLLFASAFIGLAYLGSEPPEGNVILATKVLSAYYFAFLLVVPRLLARFDRQRRPQTPSAA